MNVHYCTLGHNGAPLKTEASIGTGLNEGIRDSIFSRLRPQRRVGENYQMVAFEHVMTCETGSGRNPLKQVFTRISTVVVLGCFAVCLSCFDDNWFITNDDGQSLPAALDLTSCNLLALREFSGLSEASQFAYSKAVREGKIIALDNE